MIRSAIIALAATAMLSTAAAETRKPNHLAGIQSPYLAQHLYNAVDWYPWGPEALAKAKRENKPIFLSVGYSTCHWCHVMARESFENPAIGAFLNDHFVGIKVDRERRPDLDEQFMLATQILTGAGGWPNSVWLTPDGKPFYAAMYMPPERFLDVSRQIEGMWRNERPNIEADAERVSKAIIGYLNRTADAAALTPAAMEQATGQLFEQMDWQAGGLGQAPKFPQEAALMLLMDQAERGNPDALAAIGMTLDAMIRGGITDHVGGGFHRYTVDGAWQIPHFEKMLYNQAMIGRLLVRAHALTGMVRYRHAAERTLDFVIRELQETRDGRPAGFHAAQDAEAVNAAGEKGEGFYHVWTKAEFDAATVDHPLLRLAFPVTESGNFNGANVLHLERFPVELAAEANLSEEEFLAKLDEGLARLRSLRDGREKPHQDRKVLVSWNAMMIQTLAEAATVFGRPDYHAAGLAAANWLTANLLDGDELKRTAFDGKPDVVAGQLADYAGLGLALTALAEHDPEGAPDPDLVETARRLAEVIQTRFAADGTETAALMTTQVVDGLTGFPSYNDDPIPSGNALALELFDTLARRNGDPAEERRALTLAAAVSGHALANPQGRGALTKTAFASANAPAGPWRSVADGNVRVQVVGDWAEGATLLDIDIAPGWHINSHRPLEEDFIATAVSIDGKPVIETTYPEAEVKRLGFSQSKLSLYENQVALAAKVPPGEQPALRRIELTLQACNDEICLQPETLTFHLWM